MDKKGDLLSRKLREAKIFDTLTSTFSSATTELDEFEDVVAYLRGVLSDYPFERADRPSTSEGDINGYFIGKQSLLYDLQHRFKTKLALFVTQRCGRCGETQRINVMHNCTGVEAFAARSRVDIELDLGIKTNNRHATVFFMVDKQRLGKIRRSRIVGKSIDIVEFTLQSEHPMSITPYILTTWRGCKTCEKIIPTEENSTEAYIKNEEVLPPLDGNAGNDKAQVAPEQKGSITKIVSKVEIDKRNDAERNLQIANEILEAHNLMLPAGEFKGKTLAWMVAFRMEKLKEFMERYDHEDELKYYLKDLVEKAELVGIENYPWLAEVRDKLL